MINSAYLANFGGLVHISLGQMYKSASMDGSF